MEFYHKIFVALLRGINVGGKNKVDMKLLKKTFENSGFTSVVTYINSGNIIFINEKHKEKEIPGILEKAILKDFGLEIKVLVRSYNNFKEIISALPDSWQNNAEMKSDVMFLWDEVADKSILDNLTIVDEIDTVMYVSGTILWKTSKKDAGKSGKMKLAGSKLYKQMTVRNVNTTRKIFEIMENMQR